MVSFPYVPLPNLQLLHSNQWPELDKVEHSGSVVECLTRDRWVVVSSIPGGGWGGEGGAALALEQDMLSSA